jgi:hypothetical protein
MKKIGTFFYSFKKSISSASYYTDILKADIGFSIKYFLFLSFIASSLFTLFLSVNTIPKAVSEINNLPTKLGEMYPDDLSIEFKGGSWSLNKEEPFYIKMPALSSDYPGNIPENLIVFDKNGTIDKLGEYNTLILLNSENFVYTDGSGNVSAQPVSTFPDISINKNLVLSRLGEFQNVIRFLPYVLPIFLLLFVFIFNYLVPSFFNLILLGLGIYIMAKLLKKRVTYKDSLKICLHSMTIPIIIQTLLVFIPNLNFILVGWFLITSFAIATYFLTKIDVDSA